MPKSSEMINKTYLFRGENHTIQRIDPYEENYLDVFTEKRRIRIEKSELKEFLPVEIPAVRKNGSALILAFKEQNKSLDDLALSLDATMKKIDANPNYIPQAKGINEIARSIISLRRTQIEFLKIVK